MKKIAYIILGSIMISSCQVDNLQLPQNEGAPIYLSATAESSAITRTPYKYEFPNSNVDGVLRAAVWASSLCDETNGTYHYPNLGFNGKNGAGENLNKVAIHANTNFDSPNAQLLGAAVYPREGNDVFFVGFHPQGWTPNQDDTTASFTFDGSQDVMFAPRVKGTYAAPNSASTVRELHFYHLLTWLRFKIMAEDENTATAWGKITSMKITSHNNVSVDLNIANGDVFNTDYISYSSIGTDVGLVNLYQLGSDNVFPASVGYSMGYSPEIKTPQEVAYVLCSPVNAITTEFDTTLQKDVYVPEYTLHIETETRKVSLPLDLKRNDTTYFEGSTRAKCFTINLTFKMGNTIAVAAVVDDWTFGGIGDVDVEY